MDNSAETIAVVLAVGVSITMAAAATGKVLWLLRSSRRPSTSVEHGTLLIAMEAVAVLGELALVWLLWAAPIAGFIGSAALFSGFNLYLAWLVSRGQKKCNCFGPPTAITQNKLAVNYGVTVAATIGALVAGPASSIYECALGSLLMGGFIAFVWSSRYVARRQDLDSLREPPALGISVAEANLAQRCMILFLTPECSGCDLVLDRVGKFDDGGYPRYVVVDVTAPESLRSLTKEKVAGSDLILIQDSLGAILQESLAVRVFPSVVAIDDWVSTSSGVSVDGLALVHDNLARIG